MCPLWPLHFVLMYALLMLPLLFCVVDTINAKVSAKFSPEKLNQVVAGSVSSVELQFTDLPPGNHTFDLSTSSVDTSYTLLTVQPRVISLRIDNDSVAATIRRAVNVTSLNLGFAAVHVRSRQNSTGSGSNSRLQNQVSSLPVSVVRNEFSSRLNLVFGVCVAVLMAITFVNMGCTLELDVIWDCVVRPVGPAIGALCQFVIMPLAGYCLALLSASSAGMQLAIFVTGCSPGGGASNIWTYLLRGNVNLSVTMTVFSSLLAFATVPAWVYCLGRGLVQDTDLVVPYSKILTLLVSLIVPCGIGILIRRKLPKVANILTRLLKPWSVILFVFILSFGVYCNLHLWGYIKWNLVLSAGSLPFLGFVAGAVASRLFRRSLADTIAISIETGVQNTGVAIYILKFSLPEPANDIAILAPIIVASMTPLPLFTAMVVSRIHAAFFPTPSPASTLLVGASPTKTVTDDISNWLHLDKDGAITEGLNGSLGGVNTNGGGVNTNGGGVKTDVGGVIAAGSMFSRDSNVRSV